MRRIVWILPLILSACVGQNSEPLQSWEHADDGAYAAAIANDASLVVVSGIDNGIDVWDLTTLEHKYKWQHQGEGNNLVANIDIAFDNSVAVTSDREAFAIWDIETGEPIGFWRIDESSIRDIAVSDYGRGILVGRSNGKVMFFEPDSGRRLEFMGHQEKINSIDLSPNGFYALSGGNDYVAYLWDTRNGQVIHRFNHPSRVTKVALDTQGRQAFTADSKDNARIWNLQTGEMISQLNYIERQRIFSTARFSDDGKYLLTGSPSRLLSLWDVQTGNAIKEWRVAPRKDSRPQSAVVHAVAFWKDGQVISTSSSGLTEVWAYQE